MNPSQTPIDQLSPSQQRTQQLMQQRHQQQLQLQQQQQYHQQQQQQQQTLGDPSATGGQSVGLQNTGQQGGHPRDGSSSTGVFLSRREGEQQHQLQLPQQQQPSFPQDFKFPGFGGGGGGGSSPFMSTDNNRYIPSMLSPSSPRSTAPVSLSSPTVSGNGGGFQQSNTTGLESLESLASLSVLSPSLPVPNVGGGGNRGGGGGGGPEVVDRKNSGGYFSPSFQPPPSMPAAFQSHQQQQGSYGSPHQHHHHHHHHHPEGSNQLGNTGGGGSGDGHGTSPYPPTSSSFGIPSSISSSLPIPSNFHLYSQSQFLGSHQQHQHQQHHPLSGYSLQDGSSPSSSSNPLLASPQNNSNGSNSNVSMLSSFSRETRPRSRSGSPANHSSRSPIHRNSRINSLSHHLRNSSSGNTSNINNQTDALSIASSPSSSSNTTPSTSSATTWTGSGPGGPGGEPYSLSPMTPPPVPTTRSSARGLSIPPQPRMIPPRTPEAGTPRKYHGRQLRKVPIPTIDLVSGVRDYVVPPTRRLAHILSEQKRREKINAGFEELKSVIPECAQNTDSKATILRKAVDRILELEQELRKYTAAYEHNNIHNINCNDSENQVDQKQSFKDWEE